MPSSLNRALGLRYAVVVVIANIIGSGIYKKVALMAAELQSSGWVLVAWLLGGIITIFGALSNAEVAGLLAETGGEYVYYKKIYNRFFAFIFGWSLFALIQTAAISSLAYVFAQSLNHIVLLPDTLTSLSDVSLAGFHPFQNFTIKLVAILLIVLLTWINALGVKTGAGMSQAILILIISAILVIVVFGLTSRQASISQAFDFSSSKAVNFGSMFAAMVAAFWAYQGWASIGYIGGEVKDAKKNIPKGIAIGVAIVIALYFLVNITYLSVLSIPELQSVNSSGNKIAAVEAVRNFWNSEGALFISVIILITTLGCTHASILASARPYYAMAKEGMFFRSVARLNHHQVPVNSLLFQGVWACILVLSGSFDELTNRIIFAVFIYYGATAFGVFVLRYKMPDAPRPYKVWGYPFVPAIVVLFCIALFISTIQTSPRDAAIGLILILTGIPMYLWFRRKRTIEQARPDDRVGRGTLEQ